ncbi:hypothetical protein MROS_2682 [Melioribacter roseus P3M-2]|uniref:Glycosyltransferase subfamily 4-like N-terminal domain-containing protein n=1 Tax=Melioribacter roseus (strain DSM 23840 / JCM 17771 / VKM B-2668 / P3M-2) TaxID=1191523 RepID=I6YZD6_MELRP|nr:hypothetical protein [Melioribacter roseus]AFN75912.1 hypothetical protein MROS_2682 [Melioribacter roseus P3M-2]
MRVLIISEIPIFEKCGKEILRNTIEIFSKEFDFLIVISPDKKQIENLKNCNLYSMNCRLFSILNHRKIIGYFYNFIHWIHSLLQVERIISKNKIEYDFIYSIGPMANWIAKKINKNKKVIISRYLGIAWAEKDFNTIYGKLKHYLKNKGYTSSTDLVIMTDDGTRGKEYLLKLGIENDKILFLRNGIKKNFIINNYFKDEFIKEKKIPKNAMFLLTVSRLASWKRVDRAISIIKYVIKKKQTYS